MKLVIDIPKEQYEAIKSAVYIGGRGNGKTMLNSLVDAVADGQPMKKGKWINLGNHEVNRNIYIFECSNCRDKMMIPWSERFEVTYCPNCGSYNPIREADQNDCING